MTDVEGWPYGVIIFELHVIPDCQSYQELSLVSVLQQTLDIVFKAPVITLSSVLQLDTLAICP